jgi:HAD superfamily hydrolase (TIGR01490 family)
VEAAFFDLDKTIVARASGFALSRSFMREGLIARSTLVKSLYAQILFELMGADETRMDRMRTQVGRLTAGWQVEKVKKVVEEVLEDVFTPLLYGEAVDLIESHRTAGRLLCIVSTSPEEVVVPLARILGVERCIATRSRIVDGHYTGELDFYSYGPYKAHAMNELAAELDLDMAASFAYSDSSTDLPMLETVGNPVAVNPDKELKRVASERGWPVLSFRKPVRARGTQGTRTGRGIDGTLAAATAAGAAVAIWWVIRKNPRRVH